MFRRAQISVFIIIGILIIAIFGFMFFITSEVGKIKLETQVNKIVDSILAATPINYYVTLCLEEATKSALNVSGKQGGLIKFSVQKTVANSGDTVQYYLTYPPINTQDYPLPDAYPCNGAMANYSDAPAYCAFLDKLSSFIELLNTSLGISEGPKLCMLGNDSRCQSIIDKDFNISIQGYSLRNEPSYSLPSFIAGQREDSIENQTAVYISNATANCSASLINVSLSNLSAFKGFNITSGDINTSVVFGFNGVEVTADYPLLIKIQNYEPVIRILKFSYFSSVRYKQIYLLARWIAEQDAKELDFNISKGDWKKSPYYLLAFDLSSTKTADDTRIFNITDNDPLHALKAGPFIFRFAVENRPPVLDYIPAYDYGELDAVLSRNYDLYVVEGDVVEIHPKAYDPDGDEINYNYSGWKETEDAYFNENLLTAPGCRQNPESCIVITSNAPNNWTNSSMYKNEFPSASYKTNHSDIGIHNVTVCAFQIDNPAMRDCQTVRVLVDDVFIVKANITMTRCFADMSNDSLISIEDPICLDGSVIDYFNPGTTSYVWSVTQDSTSKTIYDGPSDSVKLPLDYEPASYTPPATRGYFFSSTTPIEKELNLLVVRGFGSKASCVQTGTCRSTTVQATASVCIPHRGGNPASSTDASECPSFPFNNLDYKGENAPSPPYSSCNDPFLGNHACCLGDPKGNPIEWVYMDGTTECFRYQEYGAYNANFLDIAQQAGIYNIVGIVTNYSSESGTNTPQNDNLKNDIMLRTFVSHCSGASGNTCSNDVIANYSNITSCADKTSNQLLRCEGANLTANYINLPKDSLPSCINFTGTTFEQYAGIEDSSVCGPPKCTADPNSDDGYNAGNLADRFYLCNATCYNGKCEKPIPEQCLNCRDEGYCSKTPSEANAQIAYQTKQSVTGASGICLGSRCGVTTEFAVWDRCIDSNILEEQWCQTGQTNKEKTPDIYFNTTVSCAGVTGLETKAEIITSSSPPVMECVPGNKSTCSDGACRGVNLAEDNANIKTESCDKTSDSAHFKFRGVESLNSNPTEKNTIAESCGNKDPVDPDTDEHACLVCNGAWHPTGEQELNCCGDDSGENWQGTQTGGICSTS